MDASEFVDHRFQGVTLTGPHRDEMRFISGGIDMGTFGSRGQQRTVVLELLDWYGRR